LAKLELSVPITVATTPERAFDFFADHRHVAQVLEGVSRWEPMGRQTQGVGARYSVEMRAGQRKTRVTLHITYEPPAAVLGAAVARQLNGFVRGRLEAAMERIRDTLES